MKKINKIKHNKIIYIILFIGIALLNFFNLYICPIKYIYGISCPLCGMIRAFKSVLKLDIRKSFYYHMLWPLALVVIIVHILIELDLIKINKKKMYFILYFLCIINLIYYFYRFYNNSSIVYFNFYESLIYKIYSLFN